MTGLQLSLLFSGPLHLAHPNIPSVQWELTGRSKRYAEQQPGAPKGYNYIPSLPRLQSNKKLRDTRTDKERRKEACDIRLGGDQSDG